LIEDMTGSGLNVLKLWLQMTLQGAALGLLQIGLRLGH